MPRMSATSPWPLTPRSPKPASAQRIKRARPMRTLHAATKPMAQRIWLLKPCAPGVSPSAETAALQAPAKRSKDGLLGVGLIMAVLLMLRSRSVAGVALAWLGGEVLVVLACLAAMLLRIGRRLALAGAVRRSEAHTSELQSLMRTSY